MSNASTASRFDLNRTDWSRWVLLALVVCALVATLYVQIPLLRDAYKIGDDLRHLYWMTGFQDPELFRNDPQLHRDRFYTVHLDETRLIIEQTNPGYSLLFYLASFLMDPILFSKVLPFILMPIYVVYLFKIGQRLKSNSCGLLLGLLGIAFGLGFPGAIRTGFQRGFAYPLTAMFLYYAIVGSSVGVTISLVIQGTFYPPALAVSLPTYILSWVRSRDGRLWIELSRKGIVTVLISLLLIAAVLSPAVFGYSSVMESSAGTATQKNAAQRHTGLLDNPAYGAEGRDAVFVPNRIFGIPLYLIVGFAGLIPNYGVAANLAPLLLLCGLIVLTLGGQSLRLDRHIWSLFVSGFVLFAVAWGVGLLTSAFVLNMPNKYVKVTIPLTIMFFIAFNLEDFIDSLLTPRRSRVVLATLLVAAGVFVLLVARVFSPATMISSVSADQEIAESSLESLARLQSGIALVGIVSILLGVGSWALVTFKRLDLQRAETYARPVGVLLFILSAAWIFLPTLKPAFIEISQEERNVIEYIATLPKDVLVTGASEVLDNLPLLAKRQVAFSPERLSEDKQLIIDSFDAYYAESGAQVLDFCQEYGVDYWVVDLDQFEAPFLSEQRFFYDPYNDEIIERIQGRHDFFFSQIPDGARLFEAGDYFVVSCDPVTFAGLP